MPSVSVSLVVYDLDAELLDRCFKSLTHSADHARKAGLVSDFHVFIVDNGGNGTALKLPENAGFNLIENVNNIGFGPAHNQIIVRTESDYHLILNPDVILPENYLEQTIRVMEADREIVLAAPRGVDPEERNAYLCKRFPTLLVLLLRGFAPDSVARHFKSQLDEYEYRNLNFSDVAEVLLVSGCCMFSRTTALRSCNGFDESFFLYFEDFDLSLRMGFKGKVICLPSTRIVHYGGKSASKGLKHVLLFCRSAIRFFKKHGWRFY